MIIIIKNRLAIPSRLVSNKRCNQEEQPQKPALIPPSALELRPSIRRLT
jgi:hypothetical protein